MNTLAWRKHLRPDEDAWVGTSDVLDRVLLRLARSRLSVERMADRHHRAEKREPMSAKDRARLEVRLNSPEHQEQDRLIAECVAAGGCTWEPFESKFYGDFPAEKCAHCGCSREWNPPLPSPQIK